jgi:hypothetical protein
MGVSTTINTTLGVVSSTDSAAAGSVTIAGAKTQVTALTSAATLDLTQAGVITVSGSSALTFVMPTAASCPGSMFVVRSLSNYAHVLTGSQETNGTKVFTLLASGSSAVNGSALTLALGGVAGAATGGGPSVALLSDGKNFLVLGSSGSVALSGT